MNEKEPSNEVAVLIDNVATLKTDMRDLKSDYNASLIEINGLHVKNETLEKRVVSHDKKHENNYGMLHNEISDVNLLIIKMSNKLSTMAGRDSIKDYLFKVLLGAFITIITGVIIIQMKGGFNAIIQ